MLTDNSTIQAVTQCLESQKFSGRDDFHSLCIQADEKLRRLEAENRRLRYRVGKLIDLMPDSLVPRALYTSEVRDCCDE